MAMILIGITCSLDNCPGSVGICACFVDGVNLVKIFAFSLSHPKSCNISCWEMVSLPPGIDKWKSSQIMGNICTSQSYFLQDIHQLFLVLRQVFFPQTHIVTSAGLSQHSWGIGSPTFSISFLKFLDLFSSTCLCSFVGEAWSAGGHDGRGGGVRGVSNEGLNTWSWKLYLKSTASHKI